MKLNINRNLISLKCVLFLFFGAIASLLPFFPLHMNAMGLSPEEAITITIVAPIVAALGPLIAAPLADRLASGFGGKGRSKTGRYLRLMIAFCLIMSTIFYWILQALPPIRRDPLDVTFMCNEDGGYILQDRCGAERTCFNWGSQRGSILVKNCKYSCNVTTGWSNEVTTETVNAITTEDYEYEIEGVQPEAEIQTSNSNLQVNVGQFESYPHMCWNNGSSNICDVYTEASKPIDFQISLSPSLQNNDTEHGDACKYPFVNKFHCRIPNTTIETLIEENPDCNPVVACELHWPYNNTDSILKVSQCGYKNKTYYLYMFLRSIGDIFTAAAVALIGTAVVIATRETSTGRGDVGKQFAFGALGFVVFAPIIGGPGRGEFFPAMISYTVLMLIAAVILVFDSSMPLSPPEWWWHTRCGLLALPMSSIRKYSIETIALAVVLLLLGIFWNAIDSFLPWHLVSLKDGNALLIGLTITIGAIPGILYHIFAEKIVDYCGHSNILILCFVSYILHHIALILITNAKVILICEVLEVFTLHLMWVTAVLYLRHLVPRKYTACGQALPVLTHFCLGRCFGALIGATAYSKYPNNFQTAHKWFTVAAAIIACVYFLLYHLYLKKFCLAPTQLPPQPMPSVVQSVNGNGSYTPLRVYHNSSSKKGHFRY